MTMLLNPQHALFNLSVNPTSSYVVSSHFDQNQNFQPPGIPVSSSLALSSSLLQAAAPLKALSYAQRARARASNVTSPASSETCKDKYNDQSSGWHNFLTATKNFKTEDSKFGLDEMPTFAPESDRSTSPSERQEDSEDTSLNLEKIERRAKASIEKLRHILLRVKTRSPEGSNAPSESSHRTCEDGQERPTEALNGHRPQSNIYYETPTHMMGGQGLHEPSQNNQETASLDSSQQHSTQQHHDAVTCTRSTVKFNKDTNTGVVTLVATVRGDMSEQGEHMKEKAIILAARALSCVCTSLEAKASNVFSTCSKGTISRVATLKSAAQTEDEVQHSCIVEQLLSGEITEAFEVKKGYGATPFRPVYVVRLLNQDGSVSHAIFKPYIPGDNHRYSFASPEWVAYQIGLLLETDMVPPAVMRRDVQVGGKCFALGTLIHFVPDVRTLTRLGPQEWGAESSVYFVSNVHILDALVGSAPRERRYFMEGLHWVRHGRRRPMILDHPHGIANGKLHPMWNPKSNSRGVQKVSHQTLAALRGLDISLLQEKLGSHLSGEEIDRILNRRDQVLALFMQSERLLLTELLTKAITKRGQQYVLHDLSKGRFFLHILTWWNFQPMHACGYGRVQAASIPLPIPILPPEPSPPGVMHHHHGHGMWPGTSSTCMQGPHGSGAAGLRTRGISRPPRKRPRLARWSAAPYLPRRSLEAMATGQGTLPRYGDEGSADVILVLKPVEGLPLPPLLLHSRALRRSEFFETRLSERWATSGDHDGPLEITLDKCVNPSTYVRCIQLLYVPDRIKHTAFNDVQDALGILEVAAELLFHDCVNACMRYLEAMPWTLENEAAIRGCVASLHLQSSPDLAARLCTPEDGAMGKSVDVMKDVLGELLALVTNGAPSKARDITERVLLANVHPSASPVFAGVNEVALLKEFQGNLGQLKIQLRKFSNFFSWNAHQVTLACSALRWLLDELFALQIADMSIKIFSEEQELAQLMVSRMYQNPFTETLFQILVRMLQALQKGEVVAPRSVRLGLVSIWLPVIAKLGNDGDDNFGKDNELQRNLEIGLGAVVETLPMIDQETIFKIWIGACLKCRKAWPDLSEAFDSWCGKLRASQREADLELDKAPLTSEVCSS